ncbi:MAG: hypothetical protein IJ383_01485 [Bacteroidales bacterium]|nr:hypothetical protein [Bacteroidales bacterium]
MQFRNTVVLAITALFMAVSCITVDKTLGDDLIPTDQNIEIFTDEIDIPVQLKLAQPMQALSSSQAIFGAIRTPEFGLAEFATVTDICPNQSGWDFGEDPVIEDIYFIAPVSSHVVVDNEQTGIPQIISLHRTYKRVDSTTVFNNAFTEADYDPEPLNTSEFMYFGGDSIKMHLDMAFAEEILASSQAERDSLDLFVEKFKGIVIKSSTPEEGVYGGRQNSMTFGAGAIYIRVDYQPTWGENLRRKDTLFCLSVGYDQCLNISSYSSAGMQTKTPGEIMDIEGSAGLKPFISKDELKQAIENWKKEKGFEGKKIIVAKGAFIFPFEIPQDNDMTKYPSSLYPCNRVLDTTYNQNILTPLSDCYVTGYSTGTMNRSLREYNMDAPSYLQEMFMKNAVDLDDTYDLWIMPIYSQTDSYYGNTYYYIDDLSYYVGRLNGPQAETRPRIRLVYSVIEE